MTVTTAALTEETDPFCLPPADAARLLAAAPWRRFAVLGDSLAAGTGDPSPGYASQPWGDRVADALRRVHPDLAYLNTGTVGATSSRILAEQQERVRAFAPDLAHVACGANDLWRDEPDFGRIEARMRQVYALAAESGALLTTFTLGRAFATAAFPDLPERVHTLNDVIRGIAADHDAVLVDMSDHPVNDRATLLSADRIHFSTAGQAVLAAEVVRGLAARLAGAAAAQDRAAPHAG
ncbi:SGNH/GDSL hydrolase family protein [Pseudonocardia humida]|uniref:SGNH/GDSL hydrolase family protein n=1 Tax=Pseudonocardia humida TaxID=2800819 RepID=A0ABT0ZZP9_9PSEU|nr:SGNH/GDSL hydrolase family protein [Pseudonocardia humida]MCO1656233.1 SGNH/GDSL hydrolase family protein [Pseudonocardia humida]